MDRYYFVIATSGSVFEWYIYDLLGNSPDVTDNLPLVFGQHPIDWGSEETYVDAWTRVCAWPNWKSQVRL